MDVFDNIIDCESPYPGKYGSFLGNFIAQVESLSVYGNQVWDNLFQPVDIYSPDKSEAQFRIEWIDRRQIDDRKFHLQCATLAQAGVYPAQALGRLARMPGSDTWRKGESQTAESLLDCQGDKQLIAALFVYALLQSGTRLSLNSDNYIFSEISRIQTNRETGLHNILAYDIKLQPLNQLASAIRQHLEENDIWHHWTRNCTSLLPIINDQKKPGYIFESFQDFNTHLAERFVLLSSKLAVGIYNLVPAPDALLMDRVEHYARRRRSAQSLSQESAQ